MTTSPRIRHRFVTGLLDYWITGLLARLHQADHARESKVSAQCSLQNHACICPFCRCGVEGLMWTFIPQIGSVDSFTYVAGSSSKC